MKKQIAVLMAAATAVTTVAPALASAADVNNYDASVSEINAKIKAALNERYKNKTEDGINASNANEVDDYLNSRYAVILYVANGTNNLDGLVPFANSEYDTSKITDALKDSDKTGEDVFGNTVTGVNLDTSNLYVVKNASKIQNLIENKVIGTSGGSVKVAIVDKGIKDGSAVETLTDKHYVVVASNSADSDTKVSLSDAANQLAQKMVGYKYDTTNKLTVKYSYVDTLKVNAGKGDQEVTINSTDGSILIGGTAPSAGRLADVNKIKLTLKSGKEYTLEANDKAFDFNKPLDKNGNELELANAAKNIYDQVDSFKFIENKDNKKDTIVLPVGDTDVYTVQDVQASTVELGKIFTKDDGYTKEGADFVNSIVNARKGKDGIYGFNYNGVNYNLVDSAGNVISETNKGRVDEAFTNAVIEATANGYQLRYNVKVKNANDNLKPVTLQFVIKGDSQKDLNIVLRDLQGKNTVAKGHFTRLEGADRYATAIEVSNENFDPKDADTVVIVGGEALMDGLSSVPLAAAKNAPILLSHPKSGLNDATLNEISRACRDLNRKTVYVVGGENSVPEKAVKQLEDKFGAVVVRVSGSDRYDTSLEVAKRLTYDKNVSPGTSNLFITGGEGAADAMSISPVAATPSTVAISGTITTTYGSGSVTPILVVPKDSVKRSTREFIDDFKGQGYIIGGESTVSTNAYRDLNQAMSQRITRIAGSDRFDTNVQILKKFYAKDSSAAGAANKIVVGGAIFASGDNKFLVDAQTAGPLAASKKAPIVLAGSKLTNDQVDLLKNDGLLSKLHSNVYQVGGVVSSDVMSVVVDKLGL